MPYFLDHIDILAYVVDILKTRYVPWLLIMMGRKLHQSARVSSKVGECGLSMAIARYCFAAEDSIFSVFVCIRLPQAMIFELYFSEF